MPQINYKNLITILKKHNCKFISNSKRGSHEKWYSEETKKYFTVSKTIKANGTYWSILKVAKIKIPRN